MRLARLCEHDRLEGHGYDYRPFPEEPNWKMCPGGVFLPDDTLAKALYEAANYEWLTSMRADSWEALPPDVQSRWRRAITNALSVREAE